MSSVLKALVAIQEELKAPKDQKAGRYNYRNIEDINEAVKPLAAKHGCAVVYTDTFADGMCVSTCKLLGPDDENGILEISAHGVSYINRAPSNMSVEQASGAASSYARKYAACGLFAIDSSENDPDRTTAQQAKQDKTVQAYEAMKREVWAWCKRNNCATEDEFKAKLEGIKKRPNYSETAGFFGDVAEEFRNG